MNSAPIYYEDTYRFSGQAVVESFGVDDKGHYIILDRTLFYPQGGGQPADQGCLIIDEQQIHIRAVRLCDKEIRHYTALEYPLVRLVKIGSFDYSPCGGTHINSSSELNDLQIIKFKTKGNSLKIHY